MPLTPSSSPHLLQFPVSSPAHHLLLFSDLTCATFFRSSWPPPFPISLKKTNSFVFPISVRREKCFSKSTEEDRRSDSETLTGGTDDSLASVATTGRSQRIAASSTDSLSLGIREPVYEVRKKVFAFLFFRIFYDGLLLLLALGGRGEVGWEGVD